MKYSRLKNPISTECEVDSGAKSLRGWWYLNSCLNAKLRKFHRAGSQVPRKFALANCFLKVVNRSLI